MNNHNMIRLNDNSSPLNNIKRRNNNPLQKRAPKPTVTTITPTDINGDPVSTSVITTDDDGDPITLVTNVVITSTLSGTSTAILASTTHTVTTALHSPTTSLTGSSIPVATSTISPNNNTSNVASSTPSHTATLLTTILVPAIPLVALICLIIFYIRRNSHKMKEEAREPAFIGHHVGSGQYRRSASGSAMASITGMSGTTAAGSAESNKKKWSNGSSVSSSGAGIQDMNNSKRPLTAIQSSTSLPSISQYSATDPQDMEDWVIQNSPFLRPVGTPHGTPRASPKQTPRTSSVGTAPFVSSSLARSSPPSPISPGGPPKSPSMSTMRLPSMAFVSVPSSPTSVHRRSNIPPFSPDLETNHSIIPALPSSTLGLDMRMSSTPLSPSSNENENENENSRISVLSSNSQVGMAK